MSSPSDTPALKVSYQFNCDKKLGLKVQNQFLALVIEPEFACVKYLEEFVGNQREEFARAFVNVLVAQNYQVVLSRNNNCFRMDC